MTNPLPDQGEWLLSISPGQPQPPFVKMTVCFYGDFGYVQGINGSQIGWLSKVTKIANDRFGAMFHFGGVSGQFDARLDEFGNLAIQFLKPQKTQASGRALSLDRDIGAQLRGVILAKQMIGRFGVGQSRGAFPNIPRQAVAQSLLRRIDAPEAINQGMTYTCGPAAFMYTFAKHDPAGYAKFVIDLYERGEASIGARRVAPSTSFRFDKMDELAGSAADWIALGSLRDSENWFFEFHTRELPFFNAATNSTSMWFTWENVRGGTNPGEIKSWFKALGYTRVVDKSDGFFTSSLENLHESDDRHRNGEKVCLVICANILEAKTRQVAAAGGRGDHFIVLASPIEFVPGVQFRLFTWGGFRKLSFRLTAEEFLNSYYGFVAARR